MQRIIQNSIWLFLGEAVWNLLLFVLLVAVARELGAFAYGQFSYAYATAAILGIFASFGFPMVLTRELAQRRNEDLFPTLLSFQMTFGALALIILGGASGLLLFLQSPFIAIALFFLLIFFWTDAVRLFIASFFHSRERMEYEVVMRMGTAVLLFLVGMGILKLAPGVPQIAAGYAMAGMFATVVVLVFFHFRFHALRFQVDWEPWKAFFRLSWPVGLIALLGAVLHNAAIILLGLSGQMTEAGWYGAAYRLASFLVVPAALIGTSFYPVLSKRASSFPNELSRIFRWHLAVMAAIGIPLTAVGFFLGPFLIDMFYGEGFRPAGLAFQILMGSVLMQFFYLPFYFLLLAAKQIRALLSIVSVGAIGNILLAVALIPIFSLHGAAFASVAAYTGMVVAAAVFSTKKIL